MKKTLNEYRLFLHCAHVSTDEIVERSYQYLEKIEELEAALEVLARYACMHDKLRSLETAKIIDYAKRQGRKNLKRRKR